MIAEERLINTFLELCLINSPSKDERRIADFIKRKLEKIGVQIQEDNAGEKIGGNCGNLIGNLPATAMELPSLLFCSHLDTIKPTTGLIVENKNGTFVSNGKTILGADDKAGIAVILEVINTVLEKNLPHGGIEIVFTVAEEVGLEGAKQLDFSQFKSKFAFVLDSGDRPGTYVVESPTEYDLKINVYGKAAHAGVEPEKGINAISCAAKALAKLPMGRIDESTTFNIGKIHGGETTNIVPEKVELWGEIRSFQREKIQKILAKIKDAFLESAQTMGAKVTFEEYEAYQGFNLKDNPILREYLQRVGKEISLDLQPVSRGGGSDANIFNAHGIITTNLGLGTQEEHTSSEKIAAVDLINAARLTLALVQKLPDFQQLLKKYGLKQK